MKNLFKRLILPAQRPLFPRPEDAVSSVRANASARTLVLEEDFKKEIDDAVDGALIAFY